MKLLLAASLFCMIIVANCTYQYAYNGNRYGRGQLSAARYSYGSRNYGYGNHRYGYRRVTCPKLTAPDNGAVKLSGVYVGNRAVHSCDKGFELVGNSVRKCQSNGKWSGSAPICRRVDCGALDNINNGQLRVRPNTRFQSIATYSCNAGFQLRGDNRRVCQADATWSGKEPVCVRVDCGPLNSIDNGQVNVHPDTRFRSTATYTCRAGYFVAGSSQRVCQANAQWSGREPSCVRVNCGSLEDIDNGQVNAAPDTRFQSTATYTCRPGFRLQGNSQRVCQANAQWSGTEPNCIRVNCGPLSDIDNGNVNIHPDTRFGSTARYSCRPGFLLVGASTRNCQANAQWSGREPYCVRVNCGPLNDIPNGRVNIQPDTRFQSTATYTCNTGFVLVGSSNTRTCLASSEWSGDEPSCARIDCGPLPDITNGQVSIAPDTQFLSIATYTCDRGFELIDGDETRRCEANGKYSGREPTCQRVSCGPLDNIDNGRLILTGTSFGDTATYICNSGFNLVGPRLRRCRANGQWSSSEPTCIAIDCGTLPAPENGAVRFHPGTTVGSTASFRCRKGFRLIGSQQRICQENGQWSSSQPRCQKITCPKLIAPRYGKVYASGNYPGDHATFTCTHGYLIIGKSRIVCLHTGVWSDKVPSCKKDDYYYPPPKDHGNGYYPPDPKDGDNYYPPPKDGDNYYPPPKDGDDYYPPPKDGDDYYDGPRIHP